MSALILLATSWFIYFYLTKNDFETWGDYFKAWGPLVAAVFLAWLFIDHGTMCCI